MTDTTNHLKPIFSTDNLAEGLRKAREFRGISLKESAKLIGISPNKLLNFEKGVNVPSLPETEALSFIYGLPLAALFNSQDFPEFFKIPDASKLNQLLQIRQRIIITQLKIAIEKSSLTLKEISKISLITPSRIKRYLDGKTDIPVDDLDKLSSCLDTDFDNFIDFESSIGLWQTLQRKKLTYSQLPEHARDFLEDHENWPYIEMIDKLKTIAPDRLDDIANAIRQLANLMRNEEPQEELFG